MKENQIKSIEESLMILPTKICRNMDHRFVNLILKDISKDIAKHHFMILKILDENGRLYVTEIVQTLGITKSQMTASVDKLLKLNYLKRETDTQDRRKIFVTITAQGSELTNKIKEKIKNQLREDIKILSEVELDKLEQGLEVLNKFCSMTSE